MARHESNGHHAGRRRGVHHRAIEPYSLALSEDAVESLSRGECPEDVALMCWEMLRWKRDAIRRQVRDLNGEP
jgi:hypothetical protein